MANPRIEEVDDASDPDEMDLDAFDFARPGQSSLAPSMDPTQSQISPDMLQQLLSPDGGGGGAPTSSSSGPPPTQRAQPGGGGMTDRDRERAARDHRERTKAFQCVYPVYFDAGRSRADGRRVGRADAVANPLAREIVEALQHIGGALHVPLQVAFEPAKTHPKDWANPGRVRVLVKQDGSPVSAKLANKHHLYKLIAEYLKDHPTTKESPMKLRIHGIPPPKDNKSPTPAVPRGFKMGTVLPLHSPALSGGGVSDTFLQDMMQQMGGQMPPGMAPPAESQKKVKDKKKR